MAVRFPTRTSDSRLGILPRRKWSEVAPHGRLNGPMPWIMAIMLALTTIAAAAGLSLTNLAGNAQAEIANGVTVQIVEAAPQARALQAEMALANARNLSGVVSATRVEDAELEALIEPWLGELTQGEEAIPIPAMIDVRFSESVTEQDLEALRAALARESPAARVDPQSVWLGPMFEAVRSLQWLALALVVLLALASGAAIWLAARTALGNNRETVEIVHLLGGSDAQIARVFQRSLAIDAIWGGLLGLIIGAIAVWFFGQRFSALESGMVTSASLGFSDWLVICLLPIGGVLLAMVTAKTTVLHSLRRIL